MKNQIMLTVLFYIFFVGCAGVATTVAPPSQTSSLAPIITPSVTSTAFAPTTLALSEPAVLASFDLLPLPGEGRRPNAFAQLGRTLYVANRDSSNLAVIREGRVRAFIPTAQMPMALATDATHNRLYAATYVSQTLSLIENDAVVKTIDVGDSIQALAFYQDKLFVGLNSNAIIEVRDPVTLERQNRVKLSQGSGIIRLVVNASRQRLYANVYGRVVVLDLNTLQELSSFAAPSLFGSLAINPNDGAIWAGIFDDKEARAFLVAYDQTGKILQRVPLGADLKESVFDSSGRIFVASSFMNQVSVVEVASGRVLADINVDTHPTALWLDESQHTLYVANEDSDSVSVIDTQTLRVVSVIPVGMNVSALLANEARGRVYAANASSDSVFVIENGRVAGEVQVGHHPVDLARDPKTNRLFVANYADGAVTVVDEDSLQAQTTLPITRALSTIAVDVENNHLFADSTMFALDTLQPQGTYLVNGFGNVPARAELVRVDSAQKKIYVFANNGIPGSNLRTILYTFSEDNLAESKTLEYRNGGNMTALAIDSTTQRVYATVAHPLAFTYALVAWDADGNRLAELPTVSRATGIVVNPRTQHLFLSHAFTYQPSPLAAKPRDNAVKILDARSLGEVGWLDVPGAPGPMAVLSDTIYVASRADGTITLIGDVAVAQPPAPTQTFTPTTYPTLTPTPGRAPLRVLPTSTSTPIACASVPDTAFVKKWDSLRARLGCPVRASESGQFAYQSFQNGFMFDDLRDAKAQVIYAFFNEGKYLQYLDTWNSSQREDSCLQILPLAGVKPVRGFGKVWCDDSAVRAKLPGATAGEQLVTQAIQRFEHGFIWATTPIGAMALFDNSTWQ